MTKFSIITINYNNKIGLKKTIESVVSQSFSDYEYIVIDGGSTDGSKVVIKDFSDKIDYWISEPDKGIYNAMNKGIDKAVGEYCLFLNSGDTLHSECVLEMMAKECVLADLVIGKVLYLNSGQLSSLPINLTMKHFYSGSIHHPATFMKRILFDTIRYDESYRIVSDWKLFIELLIFKNATYKHSSVVISDFDTAGISSVNKQLVEYERNKVLESLFPPRLLEDYVTFNFGEGYKLGIYDNFYIKLRSYKYSKYIYFVSVAIMRFIAFFRKGASFARNFPYFLPDEKKNYR